MTKNYWIIFLGAAVIAILLFFLLEDGKKHDTHKDEHRDIIAANDTLKAHDAISARIIDSLKKDINALKNENKALREGQAITRRQLDQRTSEVRRLAKEIQDHNKDTALNQRINDLVAQVENLTFLLTQYEQYTDSINLVTDSLQIKYEAKDKEREKAKAELQAAYDKLFKDYITLFDTTRGLQKSLKRQKLKTKVAAVLGAAGAVILLLR